DVAIGTIAGRMWFLLRGSVWDRRHAESLGYVGHRLMRRLAPGAAAATKIMRAPSGTRFRGPRTLMPGLARARVWPGEPYPLGATWDGKGVNFALFSGNAERVELCLFDAAGVREIDRIPLAEYTDEVWHGYLPDARPGMLYGYRVYG